MKLSQRPDLNEFLLFCSSLLKKPEINWSERLGKKEANLIEKERNMLHGKCKIIGIVEHKNIL